MNKKLKAKADFLIKEIPNLIEGFNKWGYRQGPELYFYKRVLSEVRKNKLENLLKNEKFVELLYATLVSWDMNSRGAKMKYFDDFFRNILDNIENFLELSKFKLHLISDDELEEAKSKLKKLYSNLVLMKSNGRLVSNSKTMHFILPDLVMPMDKANTLKFFYGNTDESIKKFLEIFECFWYISKNIDLSKYLDNGWNQTIPKVIDNAIIYKMTKLSK